MAALAQLLILTAFWTQVSPAGTGGPLDQALQKMEQKDYVGALAVLEKLASQPKPDPIVHYQIGVCQTILGRYPAALENFEKARTAGIDTWEVWSSIGTVHFNL